MTFDEYIKTAKTDHSIEQIRGQAQAMWTSSDNGSYVIDDAGACAIRVLAGRVAEVCNRVDAAHAAGVAEERARWMNSIARERETWLTVGPPRRRRVPEEVLRSVLARMGIMQ